MCRPLSRKKKLRTAAALAPLVMPIVLGVGVRFFPPLVDSALNRNHEPQAPFTPSARALDFHRSLFIADMHADPLLWTHRDLLERGVGSVDVPRLVEGNVALQGLGEPTKVPLLLNFDRNGNETWNDALFSFAFFQQWPLNTFSSLLLRASYMSTQAHALAQRSRGKVQVIQTKEGLREFRAARLRDPSSTAFFLSIEGGHAIGADLGNIRKLKQMGILYMGLAHFFDNLLGGSAHGQEKYGITPLGVKALEAMGKVRMLADVSHASPKLLDDIVRYAKGPVIASHTGVQGTCPSVRNLSDEQIRAVAETGGIVCITYFREATCGTDVESIVRAILYAAHLVGANHVCLGSDYDGAVAVPMDTSELVRITAALLDHGMDEADIAAIMGENIARTLEWALD